MLNTACLRIHISARTTTTSRISKLANSASLNTVAARCSHHAAHYDGPSPTIAIIGSGPAGFYTAQKVMRELKGTKVDMYEQLPVPFGLVRFGVAPDHPEVKNCQDTFGDVAASPEYTFIGNVNLGHDLPLPLLAKHYDAIVFAYGASKDRKLGLEGEYKPHIYSARAFVGWYNGLPEYRNLNPDLTAGDTAVVVGQGNVALDVARTLLSKLEHLKKTDITEYAIQALSQSTIRHVHVVGRRGPMQAAFTIKEVRELLQLDDVNFSPIPDELFPNDLKSLPRPRRRLMELLKKGSPPKEGASKSWSLDFLLSPKSLTWSSSDSDKLEGVLFSKTKLEQADSPESKVTNTDETTLIPTSTLFRSIGYKSEAIPGMQELGADFDDQKGTIRHDGIGRVVSLDTREWDKASLYCSGWVKRGPTGVIASTMTDAFQTAEAIVEDWKKTFDSRRPVRAGWKGVQAEAQALNLSLRPVHWSNWQNIDQVEKAVGVERGKPREKFGNVDDMLKASGASG
ncbi:NADPH-adrenodoxin reductase [Elasticomyces elasticus]|uniref:NADPH:adrenodoxin oxidoreductase, mitochondrial n=1 Tax=Exophiala sideris TaxID=1016849 RepID=A0ABR0J3A6_9EURO|nr:NADPH-adrenodoxin reductase [Elasticomyces elasticus]KAK5026502.1 NADPH-adrenodoxin reductase [Exophiala sideris]KAK5033757.1 NADPH-adrenodoxin reductase [Exophiala sideris]KAK5055579.1 NADPH-adrenodoxin reductase [Exophiala sideris]KAK5180037.1 NADPH-adrenodoxin reductase [Eurotiomycetes sp. CCFEE 6388]